MTDYTKADLRNQALNRIRVLGATETASAADAEYVDRRCQQMLEGLDDENLLIFDSSVSASTAVIPGRVMDAMTELLAWKIAPAFGVKRETDETVLLNRLRRHVLQGQDPIPAVTDYF